jgi:glycosyltransferase involved in cell wall biosynthesis
MSVLSIIIPAYNEAKTLDKIIEKVLSINLPNKFNKELIIVNDCSTDDTLKVAKKLSDSHSEIKVLSNESNLGKSQTVRKGILESTGDWVVIQDADLEYDPQDIVFILENVLKNNCDVGYGNRFGLDNGMIYWHNFVGNYFLSFFSTIFTFLKIRVNIADMEVCYKLMRGDICREIAKNITSKSNFGFEPEVTAKLANYKKDGKNLQFIILPIKYYPRSIAEGKKMKAFRDGFKALFEIIYFNLFPNN